MLRKDQWRRVQALTDFQQALSALSFFMELPDETTRIERKRFRSYHTDAIISYCRPFTQSRGYPSLAFKPFKEALSTNERALHFTLVDERNKVVAHRDEDRVRLLLTSFKVLDGFNFPQLVEDESYFLRGKERLFERLLHSHIAILSKEVFDIMQGEDAGVKLRQDYLHQK